MSWDGSSKFLKKASHKKEEFFKSWGSLSKFLKKPPHEQKDFSIS